MIYYFSGTGNSRYVAEQLAALTDDVAVSIFGEAGVDNDVVGLVFPFMVGLRPKVIMDFARKIPAPRESEYRYAVMTCGDDAGKAADVLRTTGFSPKACLPLRCQTPMFVCPALTLTAIALEKENCRIAVRA